MDPNTQNETPPQQQRRNKMLINDYDTNDLLIFAEDPQNEKPRKIFKKQQEIRTTPVEDLLNFNNNESEEEQYHDPVPMNTNNRKTNWCRKARNLEHVVKQANLRRQITERALIKSENINFKSAETIHYLTNKMDNKINHIMKNQEHDRKLIKKIIDSQNQLFKNSNIITAKLDNIQDGTDNDTLR